MSLFWFNNIQAIVMQYVKWFLKISHSFMDHNVIVAFLFTLRISGRIFKKHPPSVM